MISNRIDKEYPMWIKIANPIISSVVDFFLEVFSSIHAYMIVLPEPYDGKAIITLEKDVKHEIETILEHADQYRMQAFERTAISYKVKKTRVTTHRFFLIQNEETYITLSFSATGKGAFSQGAWAINTDSDISSYKEFLSGNNKWKVSEIKTRNGINVRETLSKVVAKIESDITYYFLAKVNIHDNLDNCSSALFETLTEN
jgi:hypothetical protein